MRSTTRGPHLASAHPVDAQTKVMGDGPILDAVVARRRDLISFVDDDDARHDRREAEHQSGRREDGLPRGRDASQERHDDENVERHAE